MAAAPMCGLALCISVLAVIKCATRRRLKYRPWHGRPQKKNFLLPVLKLNCRFSRAVFSQALNLKTTIAYAADEPPCIAAHVFRPNS